MTENSFFPGVIKWYDDPTECGAVIGEDWLDKAPPPKESREIIPFADLMNSIGISYDIFCENKESSTILSEKILYLRPVMQHFVDIKVGLGDLEFREEIIPVNSGNVHFPLVITIKESARHQINYHQFYYHGFDTIAEFKREFPAGLAFLHDSGYRVAFFEEGETINDVRAVLSNRGIEWLKKVGDAVFDEKTEEKFKKYVIKLNQFRPKGTHFTQLYTINTHKYSICWNEDHLRRRDYDQMIKTFTLPGSLNDEYKDYLAYMKHEMQAMEFTFSEEDALKKMKRNNREKWEHVINIYNDNVRQGTPQDIIANREGISQMTVSRWISSVKGEIARLRGDAYELYLKDVWKASGKWKNVVYIGGEGKPDFLRFNFDDSIDVVSVKCFNAVRLETSLITDEMNAKCEIKPEIAKVKELIVLGERARLVVHFFNYNSKFLEERIIDPANIPINVTFREGKTSRKRSKSHENGCLLESC